jgi:hypothetical protein
LRIIVQNIDAVITETDHHLQEGKYHALEEVHFRNFQVVPAHVKPVPISVPKDLLDKANKDVFCLTPSERRQVAEYEKQMRALKAERKREVQTRMAIVDGMRNAYPHGIKGMCAPVFITDYGVSSFPVLWI